MAERVAQLTDAERTLLEEVRQNFHVIDKDESASLSQAEVEFFITKNEARGDDIKRLSLTAPTCHGNRGRAAAPRVARGGTCIPSVPLSSSAAASCFLPPAQVELALAEVVGMESLKTEARAAKERKRCE